MQNIERITSRKNPLFLHVKKLLSSRSYRYEKGQFAGDGVKLLQEALLWDADLDTVILTKELPELILPDKVRQVLVPEDVMQALSLMEAPQGCLFICNMPEKTALQVPEKCIILDGLQDTGNVGTILRTADALEIPVILTDTCADAYNPKTVRASMGAVFRTPVQSAGKAEIISACKAAGVPLYATALSERAVILEETDLKAAVVICSEGRGVCQELLSASQKEIIIPMNPRCESLNAAVAASIVMWEMRKH